MEQRIYHGTVTPQALADYLVQHYNSQEKMRAQRIGEGDNLVVQVGYDHDHKDIRNAITIGIHPAPGNAGDLAVTMGEQQWITPQLAGYAVMMGLVGLLVTPWALFALLWPVSELFAAHALPGDIWNTIEVFTMTQGAVAGPPQTLTHPHANSDPAAGNDGTPTQRLNNPQPADSAADGKTQRLNDPSVS